jgi:type IVB pilus formation R64 PilN family outer membrane protein
MAILATVSAGCAFNKHVDVTATKEFNRGLETFRNAKPIPKKDFQLSDSAWFADSGDRILRKPIDHVRLHIRPKHLPDIFRKNILVVSEDPITIETLAAKITTASGVLVTVNEPRSLGIVGAPSTGMPGSPSPGGATSPMAGGSGTGGMPQPPPSSVPGMTGGGTTATYLSKKITIHWDGSLEGVLDYISSRFGLFWTYDSGVIAFGRNTTKVFHIAAAPVMSTVSNSISDSGMTGLSSVLMNEGVAGMMGGGMGAGMTGGGMGAGMTGGGMGAGMTGGGMGAGMTGGSGQNVSAYSVSTVWTEIAQSLRSIVGNQGNFSIAQSSGEITVTTTPRIMEEVSRFVGDLNRELSRHVWLEVEVLDVDLTLQNANEFNLSSALHGLIKSGSILTTAQPGVFTLAGASPIASLTANVPNSSTNVVLNALSTVGKTTVSSRSFVTTLNDQAVPIQNVQNIGYLMENLAGVAGLGQTTYMSQIPGTVTVGVTMTLVPHLLDSKEMILGVSIDDSNLNQLTTLSSAGSGAIQFPNTSGRSFMQWVKVTSGQTAIIGGFQQTRRVFQENGTGVPENFYLGGGQNAQIVHDAIVILVTPIVGG